MTTKVHIKNKRGTSAHVEKSALPKWLSDKSEKWAEVKPEKPLKSDG